VAILLAASFLIATGVRGAPYGRSRTHQCTNRADLGGDVTAFRVGRDF